MRRLPGLVSPSRIRQRRCKPASVCPRRSRSRCSGRRAARERRREGCRQAVSLTCSIRPRCRWQPRAALARRSGPISPSPSADDQIDGSAGFVGSVHRGAGDQRIRGRSEDGPLGRHCPADEHSLRRRRARPSRPDPRHGAAVPRGVDDRIADVLIRRPAPGGAKQRRYPRRATSLE